MVAIHAPYQVELDRQKEQAMQYRAEWETVRTSDAAPQNGDLSSLLERVNNLKRRTLLSGNTDVPGGISSKDGVPLWTVKSNGLLSMNWTTWE